MSRPAPRIARVAIPGRWCAAGLEGCAVASIASRCEWCFPVGGRVEGGSGALEFNMSGDQLVNAHTVVGANVPRVFPYLFVENDGAVEDLFAEVLQESSHRAGQGGFGFPRAIQSVFSVEPKSGDELREVSHGH